MTVKALNGPSEWVRQIYMYTVYGTHVALFNKQNIEPQENNLDAKEESPEPTYALV